MRTPVIVLVVIIAVVLAFLNLKFSKPAEFIKPEILNVSTSQATIAWLSKGKYIGRIFYMPASSEVGPMSAAESFGGSTKHEVVLTGLRASTRYTYWIGNSKTHFQFQTQPAANNPFSFLVVWGDVSDRIVPLMRSESGEFIISLTPASDQKSDWFSDVRPYVPVYNLSGIDSPFLNAIGEKRRNENKSWKLDWGGLRLLFLYEDASFDIFKMLNAPSAHTIGIITPSHVYGESLTLGSLHSILTEHNKKQPNHPVSFIMFISDGNLNVEDEGIHLVDIDITKKTGAIRVDIDAESARAVFLDENREVALKQPPLKQKRTCEECRRLADKGAYEESVKAYLEFIETHKGNFQIDDAYFAIADIFDTKLFEFDKALSWYRRLAAEYPEGTLTSLANQRIKYISAYLDYEYKPLAQFERIKAVEFARKKDQPPERSRILNEVAGLIKQYPDSNLAPLMQHWLANQYRQSEPDKAVEAYMMLRKNYPGYSESREAMVEIGETYYDAGRYRESIKAYNEAIKELPAMTDTIKSQISRSQRNIRRDKIANACWGIVAVIGGVAIFRKPRWLDARSTLWSVAAFLVLWALLSFGAWLIHEQFNSAREMTLIVFFFSAVGGLSSLVSLKFTGRMDTNSQGILSAITGMLAGAVFYLAGIFLAIYYIYVHYLIVVKL